jgi:hypothetical protein
MLNYTDSAFIILLGCERALLLSFGNLPQREINSDFSSAYLRVLRVKLIFRKLPGYLFFIGSADGQA